VGDLTPLRWMGDALDRVRGFSANARADIGYQLELVQGGEAPTDFRPMPEVGPGTMEIRVHAGSEYRVFYVARFEEAVYVLHVFQKKTQKTRDADIEMGRRRYRAAIEGRKT
jgi:phage-related protein